MIDSCGVCPAYEEKEEDRAAHSRSLAAGKRYCPCRISPHVQATKAFGAFANSPTGQVVYQKCGFLLPGL